MIYYLKSAFGFLKKVFLVIAVYFVIISLFSFFINKDKINLQSRTDPIEKNRAEIYKVINDKELNKTKEGKLTVALYRATMCGMIGEACTDNPKDADKNYNKSIFGFITNLIILPYANPPASGIYWAYSGLQNAGFIPKTYAAEGIGFAAIKPFSNLWKIFRDLSYMLLVIVLIAIGFMVMFRMKMNPQTVISVENALPKIVISLILITFSFAIAGFIIDLLYIIIGLIVSVMINDPDPTKATTFKNEYILASGWDLFIRDIRARFDYRSVGMALGSAFTQIVPVPIYVGLRTLGGILFIFFMKWLLLVVTEHGGNLLGFANTNIGVATAILGPGEMIKAIVSLSSIGFGLIFLFFIGFIYVIPWVVGLIIGFSFLLLAFRLFFLLFSSYLKLIIAVILGPFLLLFEAVPGKSAFKYWIMNIIGNLIIFPIMIFVFVLSYLIVFETDPSSMTARLPYLYGIDSNSFRLMIGLGLIFLIPDFVKTTKELLGIKELPFNIGLGTYFGGVSTGVGGGIGILGQFGSAWLGFSALGSFKKMLLGEKGIGDAAEEARKRLDPSKVPSSSDARQEGR
ncbi:MAG: hypothetical protein US40_C0016G0013 [Candidatus Roizmanbacteria bacterium GW2011_GWC2_37_13]|uniref:Uncharacterized protein n=1 Tax=Candidatus Roizmanbacteria bacterium GW2011_GWC2_37_13 TaxID=1618486 RepID=A0A0G0J8S8_9BACT|nr:MAG: hypothetical protein US38_C0017G0010 [Candidatus Roizmanbacteria bacterium GW2011_GWC1_37_12]KKQ24451.1 MAG: hypothetical protein US40_C0016G0013 [Candidatus Roizmanbacteria bacterium GW2011_GWC2_37_13]